VLVFLGAAVFVLIVGLADDIRGLPARVKFVAQLAAAGAVCLAGIRITSFCVGTWLVLDLGWWGWPLTILWIVGITNAVNLIDGLDGLAVGICAIVSAVIFIFSIYSGQPLMAVISLGLLGALTGLLFSNFNPAKIFVGDGGTYFVGFVLASASVMCTLKTGTVVGLALPALALGVPIFDTLFSVLRRTLDRRSLFSADRSHIHHRLLDMGLRHRHVVILMYVVTLLAAGLGMFMMARRDAGTLIIFGCVVLLLLLIFRMVGIFSRPEILAALRRNLFISRQARSEKLAFEKGRLQLREARSLQARWDALCETAQEIGFASLAVTERNPDGSKRLLLSHRRESLPPTSQTVRVTVPVGNLPSGAPLHLEADVYVNGSLEAAGRRLTFLGRLFDEDSFVGMQPSPSSTPQIEDDDLKKVASAVRTEMVTLA
jgi:UDP-GlcNAc:undecaprenyl-phosphate GlcNAc-1-phosphate transferase